MYHKLLEEWKIKKKKNKKFIAFSFFNSAIINLYVNHNIDIIRFDLEEYALLNGYKDSKRVMDSDFLKILTNLNLPSDIMFAVDVPLNVLYAKDSFSIEKIIDFYQKSRASFLVFNLDEITDNLSKKLVSLEIPVILNINHTQENDLFYERIKNRLKSLEENGIFMIILKNFPASFVTYLKDEMSIPVINTVANKKSDGFYGYFSDIFGLISNNKNNKYLNLYELIEEAINDCVIDIDRM